MDIASTVQCNHLLIEKEGSKKLAVFFSGTYKNNGRFDFWRVGQAQNCHVLLLNNGPNDWYQTGVPDFGATLDDSIDHIKALASRLGVTEIYTIGVSMGGYGAILFGMRLEAKILAFGVDTLLKIKGSRSLKSMPEDAPVVFPDLVPLIKKSKSKIRLYVGEQDVLDIYAASRISKLPNVTAVSVRGMDHGGGRYVDKTKGLTGFVARFITNRKLPEFIEAGELLKVPGMAKKLYQAHCAGLNKKWVTSERQSREALAMDPNCEAARYSLATALMKLKRYDDAAAEFAIVAAYLPNFVSARFYLAYCMRMMGRTKVALHMLLGQLEEKPESAPTHFSVALTYEAMGDTRLAILHTKKAVKIKPKNAAYKDKLEDLRSQMRIAVGVS